MSTPIGDAAALFGLPPSTLRWWEREGLVEPVRDRSGRRGYRDAELRRIAIVYLFRNTAMLSLGDIKALMEHRRSGENWQPTLSAHAAALDQRITQLAAARDYLRHIMRCTHEDPMRCPYLDHALRRRTPWGAGDETGGDETSRCGYCGEPVEQRATGRPRRYCSHACRQRAYRRRTGPR